MKFDQMFPSRFLKADDLDHDEPTYTISSCTMEEFGPEKELKPVLEFKEVDKALVCNKTNARILFKLFGDSDNWTGKRITLTVGVASFQGKAVNSIQLRKASNAPTRNGTNDVPF